MKAALVSLKPFLIFFVTGLFVTATATAQTTVLRAGWYRASIVREDGAVIIFNAELQQKNGKRLLYIRNATERLLVDDIKVKGDSVLIEMPFFESYFRLQLLPDGSLKGKWFKAGSLKLLEFPVTFVYGQKERFPVNESTTQNATGRWQVSFTRTNGADRPAIAEFKQNGSALS